MLIIRRMQTAATKTTFGRSIKDVLQTAGELQQTFCCDLPADLPGVRGLYTGLSASIFRQLTYSIVRLGAYDKLKTEMAKGGKKLSTLEMVMCASTAGALGGLAGNPADIILVR
jgi:dicarboxylate transporter 10